MEKTYQNMKDVIKQVKQDNEVAFYEAEEKLRTFIKGQTFTGYELLQMRDIIRKSYQGTDLKKEPCLDKILRDILENRK